MEDEFSAQFGKLTGNSPFPWQRALYDRFTSDRPDNIPASCNLPTGLGKTSVIAIWLLALLRHPTKMPRRLVYVVNRRTVVDQTTFEVEKYQKLHPDLRISTLRGQFADNRQWSADPSKPAVICGTVDMIGSRLLFSGYGVGFKGAPLHAGFLGQDALIVHDEAHLEPAFQDLLTAIELEQINGRFPDHQPVRVMELTATSRGGASTFGLTDEEKHADFSRTDVSEELRTVWCRTHAKKTLAFHEVADEKKSAVDRLATLALAHEPSGKTVLVFVRTVDNLAGVVDKLPKERTQQLTGTMRGLERDGLISDSIFKRFLPNASSDDRTVYLVCTSAGEVGVNISADHLVCDLSTFESMAQRFGRVNRFGHCENTRIDIVFPKVFDDKVEAVAVARQNTLDLLRPLVDSASPAALGAIDPEARAAAFSPRPLTVPTSDILFDSWSMTSVRGKMPGRPAVEPFLHGISAWEPPQTKIAWRSEVSEVSGHLLDEYSPEDLLEAYPLKPPELLTDRSDRIFKTLTNLDPQGDTPVWMVDDRENIKVSTLSKIIAGKKEDIEGLTLILSPHAGGLKKVSGENDVAKSTGFFTPEKFDPAVPYDVADKWEDNTGPMRLRKWSNHDESAHQTPSGMKTVQRIAFPDPQDEDAQPIKVWYWYVRVLAADADARSSKSYDLPLHLTDAQDAVTRIVSSLSLEPELQKAVILAARFHDLGKDRVRWQNGIGNYDYPEKKWAKSGKQNQRGERSAYRHEFGSILDTQAEDAFKTLSPDMQELVRHLIAAHHGRGRPHFTMDETLDDKHDPEPADALALETPRRFARLQRKYGRWGLAYLESLVRAADYEASRKVEEGAK